MNELFVECVTKSFADKRILTDVFVSCKPGEIVGLLGRNGAGKSTLLKIIFGSLSSQDKFVRVDGKRVNSLFESRNLMAYLPQDGFLPKHLKIKNIISLFCNNKKKDLYDNKYIKPILTKKGCELSSGEKRYLELFLITHSDSKYILIDEPFNGLDPIHKEDIKKLIPEVSQTKGLIITDHDYRNILEIATRIIIIIDGHLKEIKSHDELKYHGYIPY